MPQLSPDISQRGGGATRLSAPVGRSSARPSAGFETTVSPPSAGGCCGRDGRTPKNRRGARGFSPIVAHAQPDGADLDYGDMSPLSLHGRQAESDRVNLRASGARKT